MVPGMRSTLNRPPSSALRSSSSRPASDSRRFGTPDAASATGTA